MASTKFDLEQGTWTQITTDDKNGDIFHNNGNTQIVYVEAETIPLTWDSDTPTMAVTIKGQSLPYDGVGNDSFIFAYAISSDAIISVTPSVDSLGKLSTGDGSAIARIKVDAQPTSFEGNTQFKIAHRFNGISGTNQIVYWFQAVNAVNIMERVVRLKEGKREYLVIPDPQDGTYDSIIAQLSAAEVPVRSVNGNLQDSGLATHPVSAVNVLTGVGNGLFTIGDDDQYPNFDLIGVGTQGNSALNPSAGVDSNMSGVAAGLAFFLVLDPYDSDTTSGQFYLQWEERF